MESTVSLDDVYTLSQDVVAREIEGELIIVPLISGIGDIDDALYTLNPTCLLYTSPSPRDRS